MRNKRDIISRYAIDLANQKEKRNKNWYKKINYFRLKKMYRSYFQV